MAIALTKRALDSKDLRDGKLQYDQPRQITYEGFSETHRRTNLEPGDILLANCGASIGRVGIAQDDPRVYKTTFQKSVSVIKANREFVDNRFLYYFLALKSALLIRLGNGAAQPNLLIGDLKRIEVPVPPMPVQRRIAGILSAYDELIENSQRRIRSLEEMARALYRERFARPRDGAVGKLGVLADLCDSSKEPYKEQIHAERPLVDLARIPQRSIAPLDTGSPDELSTSRIVFEPGDTLFGSIRCYLHKVVAAHYPGVTNTSVLVLRPKKPFLRPLVALVASDPETIRWADAHSSGTKMPVIGWSVLRAMPVAVVSETQGRQFESVAGPMLVQIGVLADQIQNLRRTRDLLLPRLLKSPRATHA